MALAVYKIFCSPTLWIQRYSSPAISFIWPVSFRHPLMHRAKMNPWFLASGSQSAQQHYSSYGRGRMRQDVDEWVSASDPGLLVVHLPVDGLEIGFHPCQTTSTVDLAVGLRASQLAGEAFVLAVGAGAFWLKSSYEERKRRTESMDAEKRFMAEIEKELIAKNKRLVQGLKEIKDTCCCKDTKN